MIETWSSYSIADLVMFSSQTYSRLFERANAGAWPAYLLLVALLAWFLFDCRDRRRIVVAYLALALSFWLIAAWFFVVLYSTINPFAFWAALAFVLQGALLLAVALSRSSSALTAGSQRHMAWAGYALVLYGLLLHPLIGWFSGRPLAGVELAGVAPDPTALVTIGVVLLSPSGYQSGRWRRWLLWTIPLAWCLVSALTLYGLGLAWPFLSLLVASVAIAVAGGGWQRMRGSPAE